MADVDSGAGRPQPRGMVDSSGPARPAFYEFFAGGGMVRAGLGEDWRCLFANDIDPRKAAAYRDNWGGDDFHLGDISEIEAGSLPGAPDLVWGSFPCQDLSLAGAGAGLDGRRSSTFHAFFGVVRRLAADGRAPPLVAIENVCGALTSRGGRDFEVICRTFLDTGYRPGALVINADRFLPQSRPRLFVVGLHEGLSPAAGLDLGKPFGVFHPAALVRATEGLLPEVRARLAWWRVPEPSAPPPALLDLIEPDSPAMRWHSTQQTERLLDLMTPLHREKLRAAGETGRRVVGTVFRRTRAENGLRVQRAEIRFDQAGCLRTPAGGSSRQIAVVVEGRVVRSRLLTARETARLMGMSDNYRLPPRFGAAVHLTGDGVAVPVVRHLAETLFEPLLSDLTPGKLAA